MPDASGLLALGQALDDFLVGEYSPPPGTQTALGFLPGIAVNPASFAPTGVVNPLAVHTFLNSVVNVLGPVLDGRFAGFVSAHQVYGTVIDVASPLDPPGTPASDAFLSVKNTARSAFGASPVKPLVAVPLNWYDPANQEGWAKFSTSTSTSSSSAEGESSSSGTPPVVVPPRFEKLWRWRTLDEAVLAEVVLPAPEAATSEVIDVEPVRVEEHQVVVPPRVVRDHRGVDVREFAVRDRIRLSRVSEANSFADVRLRPAGLRAATVVPVRAEHADRQSTVLARAPRRQLLAALEDAEPLLAPEADLGVRGQAAVRLLRTRVPQLVAEIDDDVETSSSQSVESSELSLSLEYCFVQVSRDQWWNDAVLRMPRWYAPGCRAGDFSSGAGYGGLPLGVPIAMVLTRNVTVSGRWSEADRRAAESHTSFGPWSTRDFEMREERSSETVTLTIPGTQVVAVVCALLPALAPADDPALPPLPTEAGPAGS